jgi:hypothetical protein
MERNDSVVAVVVGKETSSIPPSGRVRAMELFVVPKSMPIAGRVECGETMVQKNNSKLHAGYRSALDTGRDAANRQHPFWHRSFPEGKISFIY